MKTKKILVVDDEEDICEILQFNLENAGFIVDKAYSAEEALSMLNEEYGLILLDVMLGGISGYQMANKIRNERHNNIPIIFLTAKNTENDMLTGFSLGGDDYITKPFSVQEVIARVKAVFRRLSPENIESSDKTINCGNLVIDMKAKTVIIDNNKVVLTKKEYLILVLLCSAPGTFYSRSQILDKVWKDESYVLERSVDVHITRLRKKLGSVGNRIINRAGFGYCFEP